MDTVAGFTKYGGNRAYLHVICDHMSRYCWTFPSKSTSTLTYIQTLKKVFQEGIPKNLLTDRAPAFTSAQFRRFLISQGIKPLYTTANHPQSNGLSERLNATITGKLKILHLEHPKQTWTKQIERVTRIYNLTPHTVTGFPPIYLLKGIVPNNLNNHVQTFPELSEARRIALQKTQARHKAEKLMYDQKHKKIDFVPGDLVLVKVYRHPNTPKLEPNYTGPYEILEILSPQVVRINRPNRPLQLQTEIINIEKLRRYVENIPHITPPTDLPDSPPRQNYFLFPYRHFTTDILGDPGSSRPRKWFQPFNHLDNSIFTDEKFYKPDFPITSKPTFSSIVKATKSSTLVLDPKINPFDNMVESNLGATKEKLHSKLNPNADVFIPTTLATKEFSHYLNKDSTCNNFPGVELTPTHIFSCPAMAAALQKIDMDPEQQLYTTQDSGHCCCCDREAWRHLWLFIGHDNNNNCLSFFFLTKSAIGKGNLNTFIKKTIKKKRIYTEVRISSQISRQQLIITFKPTGSPKRRMTQRRGKKTVQIGSEKERRWRNKPDHSNETSKQSLPKIFTEETPPQRTSAYPLTDRQRLEQAG
ncbi:hypothetical protein LAZ67_2000125 [Cordylochernes scorpioides]|uniref:Integrase catalytic domain-containing protein n=1 Tax=Cordylochernes scorpioides TaxID=51811 RepID=A0ABY6K3G0_9ARAC|nr:hypothetical protein LAZ67_2000125 [Cordylochernes scorpioides]